MAVSTQRTGRAPDGRTLAIEEAGLDWFEGMGQENVDDFRLLTSDPQAARDKLEKRPRGNSRRVSGRSARAERVRARRRHRLPHLFRLRSRRRRDLGHVAMARPGAARP